MIHPMISSSLNNVIFNGGLYPLSGWSLIKVTGSDAERFLQGQTTNDVKKLVLNETHFNCRVNQKGQLQFFFYLNKIEDGFQLFIPKIYSELALAEFDKFIIADDVSFERDERENWILVLGPVGDKWLNTCLFSFQYCNQQAFLLPEKCKLDLPEVSPEDWRSLHFLSGQPIPGLTKQELINNTFCFNLGVDLKKGCFIGQETVAKVDQGRGAAQFPVLLETKDSLPLETEEKLRVDEKVVGNVIETNSKWVLANLLRDYRVEGKELSLSTSAQKNIFCKVRLLPILTTKTNSELSRDLFIQASQLFNQSEDESLAIPLFKRAIELDPQHADAYEGLGVLYGRLNQYQEAVDLMKKLQQVDPNSVMAHTNLSLFYMKQGKIEEAEAEKALATTKSFKYYANQAQEKKRVEEEERKQNEELIRREGMFKQVLEIDPEDTLANYGLGTISFDRKEYDLARGYLEKVLNADPQYSVAYLALGKTLEGLGEKESAKSIYEKGIEIAAKKGDLMPANEMQSRFAKLTL